MKAMARWRAPATVLALLVLTLALVVRLVTFVRALPHRDGASRSEAFSALSIASGSVVLTLTVGLLVVSCFAPPAVPGRRALAAWGALVAGVSLLAGLAVLVVGLQPLAAADVLAVGIAPLTTLVVLLLVCWGLSVAALHTDVAPPVIEAPPPPPTPEPEPEPEPDPEQQPTWSSDAAAGAVWRTAGEAARGGAASGWGASDGSGWARPAESAPELDPDLPSTRPPVRDEDHGQPG